MGAPVFCYTIWVRGSNPAWEQPHRLLTGARPAAASGGSRRALRRKKQGESAPRQGAEATFVSDRFGRWFESNLGSERKENGPVDRFQRRASQPVTRRRRGGCSRLLIEN